MIPVLGVPVLNRYDLFYRMLRTVDEPVGTLVIVDNGGGLELPDIEAEFAEEVRLIQTGANLGVAASWNLIIRSTLFAPWWAFTGADVEFGAGDMGRLAAVMDAADVATCAHLDQGWSLFAVNAAAVDTVGWFDEHYHPAYCEDCDWRWRAQLLAVPLVSIPSTTREGGSVTIAEPDTDNGRTYPEVVRYHVGKWGGGPWAERWRQPERTRPINETTTPSLAWLRQQAW